MAKIGEALIKLRAKSGKKQREIADLLGISDKTLGHWENDKREPSFEMLGKLAEIYNVTIGDFFGEAPGKPLNTILIDKIINDLIDEKILTETQSLESLDAATKQILNGALNKHITDILKNKTAAHQ